MRTHCAHIGYGLGQVRTPRYKNTLSCYTHSWTQLGNSPYVLNMGRPRFLVKVEKKVNTMITEYFRKFDHFQAG